MNPHSHFLFPFIIALILVKLNILSWQLAIACSLIAVFIDIDHYVEHILHYKRNRFSLKATWNDSVKPHRFCHWSFIHHWNGALILTAIFAIILLFNWKISLILGIAYYSHFFLDHINLKANKFVPFRILNFDIVQSNIEILLNTAVLIGLIAFFLI